MTVSGGGELLAFWAKTGSDGGWHPLVHHAADAAAVIEVLWERLLSDAERRAVADGLGLAGAEETSRWLRLFAWLHDSGKLTARFQRLDGGQAARLERAGWSLREGRLAQHGAVSGWLMARHLGDLGGRFDVRALATAVGGHHGAFLADVDPADDLAGARKSFVLLARARTGVEARVGEVSNVALAAVAGLVTLSDWIASNVRWFPLSAADDGPGETDLDRYEGCARERAEQAWRAMLWTRPDAGLERGADRLCRLFPFIARPSAMQDRAVELAGVLSARSICVVEDRTGSGKTEAAVVLADGLIGRGQARGLFVGLPTRATADQAYRRVADAFAAGVKSAVRVELVHGFASLTPAYWLAEARLDLVDIARDDEPREPAASEGVVAGGWFSQRKRGLLAPVAVGTVDQALLAALPSRHYPLRLLGLMGKVLVLDEVHAYDVYMSTLTERLLEWLGALGCPVILLSATLPRGAREALLAAHARGTGRGVEDRGVADAGVRSRAYPRVTVVDDAGRREGAVVSAHERRTRVELRVGPAERTAAAVARLARDGLEVAVIANTVRGARWWLSEIERHLPHGVATELAHARFRLCDRAGIEERVVAAYGRGARRPGGSVVVATQVLEQSLDLDFDLVVSELAPVDLLAQRAGRSHRHSRARAVGAGEGPWLWVAVEGEDESRLPIVDRRSVYNEHVLLRSYVALRTHLAAGDGVLVEDRDRSDIDTLVQRVYGDHDMDVSCQRWTATQQSMTEQQRRDREIAGARAIVAPGSEELLTERTGDTFDEEDPAAAIPVETRLGADPIRVLLLDPGEQERLAGPEARGGAYPPELVAWLTMRTASLPAGRFRGTSLRPEDRQLAERAPSLAWVHRVDLDADGRGTLLGVALRNDRRLGVLLGSEASA